MTAGSALLCVGTRACLFGVLLTGLAGGCSSKNTNTDGGMTVTPQDAAMMGPSSMVTLSAGGIAFDDWIYSAKMKKVVVPGAATGNLYFVDVASLAVTSISGFPIPAPQSEDGGFRDRDGGFGDRDGGGFGGPPDGFVFPPVPDGFPLDIPRGGINSVAEAPNGLLYVSDPSDGNLYIVDPAAAKILGTVAMAAAPDYVRYVATTNELWVSEPQGHQIEVLSFGMDGKTPAHSGMIAIMGMGRMSVEGLYIDDTHGVAFTNGPNRQTLVLDLKQRMVTGMITSGCMRPAAFAADVKNNILFVACSENGMVSVDVAKGMMISEIRNASTPQGIDFSPALRHLYLPGPSTDIVAVPAGMLQNMGGIQTPFAQQRVLADDQGNFWNQESNFGALLRTKDPFPANQ